MSSKGSCCCCRRTVIIISFAAVGVFLLVAGLVLRLGVMHDLIDKQVDSNVELKPGSSVYEEWVNASTPIYMQYYVFDLKNPEEVFAGTDIPTVEQKGPYSYRELRFNEVLNWSSDSTIVTFMPNRTYIFDPETSCSGCNDKTDTFTTVNIPFLTTALWLNRTNYKENHPTCFFGLQVETEALKVSLFHNKTVYDILWGYNDPLLEFAILGSIELNCPVPKDLKNLNTSVVQLQYNNTYFGITAINTGRQDINKLEQYVTWRGEENLNWWTDEYANMINGTDGSQFSPRVSKDDVLYGFSPEICRSFYAIYNSTVTLKDISLYRFHLPAELYLSGDVYPPNKGFCVPPRCLPTGLLNISLCQPMNPPIAMSPPHFCYGNSSLVKAVRGLSPDETKHGSFIDVEPITGIVMHAAKRLQVNVALEPVNVLPASDGNFEPVFLPVLWVSENAMISEEKASSFRHKVYLLIAFANVFEFALIALGALCIVIAICLLTIHAVRSHTGKEEGKPKSDERSPLVGNKKEVYA